MKFFDAKDQMLCELEEAGNHQRLFIRREARRHWQAPKSYSPGADRARVDEPKAAAPALEARA